MQAPDTANVTVLGCDGSYPGPGGAGSGYLVRSGPTLAWLDAGPGTFARLQQVADPNDVGVITLSHEHPDHWVDIEAFAVWRMLEGNRDHPVTILAPPGLRAKAECGTQSDLQWIDVLPSDRIELGPKLHARFVATDHGPPTLAVRLDQTLTPTELGHSLAYSADTGPDWSLEEFGRGIGTAIVEATHTAAHEGTHRHLSGRQAGTLAQDAQVGRLVITHRWPTVSAEDVLWETTEQCDAPVLQAAIGLSFDW